MIRRPPRSTLFPTRRSSDLVARAPKAAAAGSSLPCRGTFPPESECSIARPPSVLSCWRGCHRVEHSDLGGKVRSEEHTSELQSLRHIVCRLFLVKKK